MLKTDFPPISEALVKRLKELFPDKVPTQDIACLETLWMRIGEQNVIRKLEFEFNRQNGS